ncbi:hypothetical protein CIPAW_08G084100 [Carya illinoinensis]|uniref:Sugar phosphate transporter domain-containing protein n=1 Tax=Carya illinoinensis TaxID=32201 RepID=A0A8T1PVJ0_CARIL|nr:hypothetical protein CIPAW_08G084100 [Carya illinoinensis]KAG6699891.1 hypothetical protein I3842_08G084800 [Carya illinoinensis]KAG6699892.1 hypothetical protein I3842_08G084800 [Carya illinoinensis]KAG6699893.1 hypothetical protein I3842_08G084800 [Carya illinoinensis]
MISRQHLLTYIYLLVYILLSSGVILYNKWVLSTKYFNFPYPITLTMIHMGFSGAVAFFLIRVFKVVSPIQMTFKMFGNTAYLYISVAFIQMLKALMPVATFLTAVVCGIDKLSLSNHGHVCFIFLFVPWYFLEKPVMEVSQIQFNSWIFFSNALCALALNFSIFLVIGRTGAVTIRVAGVLKDWILIALSTALFPESMITSLNIIGYAIALCGVIIYNYLKVRDSRASQFPPESLPDRAVKEFKMERKESDVYVPNDDVNNNNGGRIGWNASIPGSEVDEEATLIPPLRLSHLGRSQLSSHTS